MAFSEWDSVFSRHEPEPIDKFKNKSRLLKSFGPNGVRVYNALDSTKTAMQVQQMLGLPGPDFSAVMDFLIQNQMVNRQAASISSGVPAPPPSASASAADPASGSSVGPIHSMDEGLSETSPMSDMERKINDRFGPLGLKVYALIDGHRTAEQILNQTGISETQLVQILEFMNQNGIIKLEKPAAPPPSSRPPPPPASRDSGDSVGFKPMVESEPADEASRIPGVVAVDVPRIPKLSLLQKAQMNAILALKYSKLGTGLLSHLDGSKDFVQIAIETGLSMSDLDIVFGELGKSGLLSFKPLTREEIRHRYGDDGLSVYKRYGRDGLLVYNLIGKANSIQDIIKKSRLEPQRAADIIVFVHKMLGLDVPLDRDMLMRYLGGTRGSTAP